MRFLMAFVLAALVAVIACETPKQEQKLDKEGIRQRANESSKKLDKGY